MLSPVSVTATIFGETPNPLCYVFTDFYHTCMHVHRASHQFHLSVCFLLFFREACSKIWGEELKELVEDRGKRGQHILQYYNLYTHGAK